MFGLPKPTTFADGQRQFFGYAMAAAGVFAGVMSVGLVGLFYSVGTHHTDLLKFCLQVIAGGFAGFLLAMIIVIISMAVGGPVGRLSVHASKEGVNVEADGKGSEPAPSQAVQPVPGSPGLTP